MNPTISKPCPFCDITTLHPEFILRETVHTRTLLSNPKLMDGHLLVTPKRHVRKLSELGSEERTELFEEVIRAQEKLLNDGAPGCDICQHFRPFIPDNKFKVSHLHMHVRPRIMDDELYTKVQSHEKDVFRDVSAVDVEKYRELFQK